MDATSKRIDGTLLQVNQGKVVRVIGKMEQYDESSAIIKSNGDINLNLSTLTTGLDIQVGSNYEVIGKIGDDLTITVYSILEISDNFKFENYYHMIQFVNKVPELYY